MHRELRVYHCADGHLTVVPTPTHPRIPAARPCERCGRHAVPRQRAAYDAVSRPGS